MLWHNRFGHVSLDKLKCSLQLPMKYTYDAIQTFLICAQAKQTHLSFPHTISTSKAPFDLIHVDVWRPHKHATHDGHKYFITILDDFTRKHGFIYSIIRVMLSL